MKKLILAVAVCCTFCTQGIATNSDAKFKRIEMLEKKINALKAERISIENKIWSSVDESILADKKKVALKDKITNLPPNQVFGVPYYKALLEKSKNDLKISTLYATQAKFRLELNKIEFNIDKSNIGLIKAELKVGKKPKIPLELAKAIVKYKYGKSGVNLSDKVSKTIEAKIKEKEACVKLVEDYIELAKLRDKAKEISEKNNNSYSRLYNTNTELAEFRIKLGMSRLKLKQAESKRVQLEMKDDQAQVEFSKAMHKFHKIYLKFNKEVDEKNFDEFFYHQFALTKIRT
jgi:hypothetical protein